MSVPEKESNVNEEEEGEEEEEEEEEEEGEEGENESNLNKQKSKEASKTASSMKNKQVSEGKAPSKKSDSKNKTLNSGKKSENSEANSFKKESNVGTLSGVVKEGDINNLKQQSQNSISKLSQPSKKQDDDASKAEQEQELKKEKEEKDESKSEKTASINTKNYIENLSVRKDARSYLDSISLRGQQVAKVEQYLYETGISTSFKVIFGELIAKRIKREDFYTYTASRLREIGKEREGREAVKRAEK